MCDKCGFDPQKHKILMGLFVFHDEEQAALDTIAIHNELDNDELHRILIEELTVEQALTLLELLGHRLHYMRQKMSEMSDALIKRASREGFVVAEINVLDASRRGPSRN